MVVSRRAALFALATPLLAEDFWDTQPPEQWTQAEIEELTSKSPWAKKVSAQMSANSPLSSRISRRYGVGANTGVGSPKFEGVVRWASAKPVRLALKLKLPREFANHYVISVSDLPVVSPHSTDDSEDPYEAVKAQTSLQGVYADVVQPDRVDTSTMYFGFPVDKLKLTGDETVTFSTVMDPLSVKTKFELRQMKYKGELAL